MIKHKLSDRVGQFMIRILELSWRDLITRKFGCYFVLLFAGIPMTATLTASFSLPLFPVVPGPAQLLGERTCSAFSSLYA
jgi:hypothetical protein